MSHAANTGKFYTLPTVRLDWLNKIQAKTYCGRRPADHPSRQTQPLDPIDLHVAMRLLSHLNRKTGQLNPEHATIAAALGVSVATVWRSMDRLAEHNFLKATERFRNEGLQTSNQYALNLELAGHDATSSVMHPVRRRRRTRGVIGDVPGTSSMNDEPRRRNLGEENRGEENAHSAGPADAVRNDRDEDKAERGCVHRQPADHWPSDGFDQFVAVMPAYNPFDGYDDSDLTEDLRVAGIRFNQLRKSGKIGFNKLMEGVRRYAAEIERTGRCPCKPATFITGERWEDEYSTEKAPPANDNPEPAPQANDNAKFDRASGDGSTYGGESDPGDAF
ncbi:hypothetical protein ACVWYH_004473 [Bradyrhizobium sp. GM24.11]